MEKNSKKQVGQVATEHRIGVERRKEGLLEHVIDDMTAPLPMPIKPISKSTQHYLFAVIIVLFFFMASWSWCSIFRSKILIGSTEVLSNISDASLTSILTKQADAYQISIDYPNNTIKKYPLQQLGLSLDVKDSLQITRQQQYTLINRVLWWRPLRATLIMSQNIPTFRNFVTNDIDFTVQPSKDATLTISNGNIELTDAVTGTQYGLVDPYDMLLSTASKLSLQIIKLQTLSVNPALTAAVLEPYKTVLEKTIDQPVKFTIGNQIVTPSPSQIADWLDITTDDKTKKVTITPNSGKIVSYINTIAAAAIHPAVARVEINQPDGSTKILVNGINGVDVLNKTDVATSVSNTLLNGSGVNLSLPVSYQPFKTISTGSYPKWIEIDLTSKRLYAYEYANLAATDLVSAGAPATPTVTGQYAIYAKYDQQTMSGANVDGSTYVQPNVPWVNYFYKDFAIHGNYWRPISYFGNINSSHGCVGLRDNDAEWIYNWAPIGTPVVIYN